MTMLGLQNRDFFSSQYPPPPGEDIVSRARSFWAFCMHSLPFVQFAAEQTNTTWLPVQSFNELHYTEALLSGISVSTTIALADNEKLSVDLIPPIYLMKYVHSHKESVLPFLLLLLACHVEKWRTADSPYLRMRLQEARPYMFHGSLTALLQSIIDWGLSGLFILWPSRRKYRMDSSTPKLYMRIYPYQGLVYNNVETEFDAIKRIYLNKIPLGRYALSL